MSIELKSNIPFNNSKTPNLKDQNLSLLKIKSPKKNKSKKNIKHENSKTNFEDEYLNISYKNNSIIQNPYLQNNQSNNKKVENNEYNNFKIKFKTEICHFWEMNGYCKYGNNCAFAHGESELKNRKLSFNYKTKPCKQFFEIGFCSYGSRCQFSHKKDYKISVNYLKILTDFLYIEKISENILLKPRLAIFESLAHSNLKQIKEYRIQLYEDLLNVKNNNLN